MQAHLKTTAWYELGPSGRGVITDTLQHDPWHFLEATDTRQVLSNEEGKETQPGAGGGDHVRKNGLGFRRGGQWKEERRQPTPGEAGERRFGEGWDEVGSGNGTRDKGFLNVYTCLPPSPWQPEVTFQRGCGQGSR